jgi:hypothetical protein
MRRNEQKEKSGAAERSASVFLFISGRQKAVRIGLALDV